MDKYKFLAYAQGVTTGLVWSFGSYWTASYMPYTNLLAAQAISGITYSATAAYASDEYYENMNEAYISTTLYTALGKVSASLLSIFNDSLRTYIPTNAGGEVGWTKIVNNVPVGFIKVDDLSNDAIGKAYVNEGILHSVIDFIQAFALPLVSGSIRIYAAQAELVENEVILTGETIDNINI